MHNKLIKKYQGGSTVTSGTTPTGIIDFAKMFGGQAFGTGGDKQVEGAQINQAVGAGLNGALQIGAGLSTINSSNMSKMQKDGATLSTLADGTSTALMQSGNPYAMAAGLAIKGADVIGNVFMKNNGASKAAKEFNLNDTVATSTGYGGITSGAQDAKSDANAYQKSGMFGKLGMGAKRLQNELKQSNIMQTAASSILNQNKDHMQAAANSQDLVSAKMTQKNYNSDMWNNGSVQFGRNGLKINLKSIVRNAKKNVIVDTPKELEVVEAFKEGGAINVIVDGKLHAHKHSLKADVEELADANITSKGVPVVSKEEGGDITQHAEVEREELILHLEVTKKLEKLMEKGDEDALIAAGKLLAKELMENTEDKSETFEELEKFEV